MVGYRKERGPRTRTQGGLSVKVASFLKSFICVWLLYNVLIYAV